MTYIKSYKKLNFYFSKRELTRKSLFVLVVFLVRISLDISYIFVVEPYFSYMSFFLQINELKILESYVLTLILALIIPYKVEKPSDFLIVLLFLLPILPTLSLYGLKNENRIFTYMIVVSFLVILLVKQVPLVNIVRLRNGKLVGIIICILAIIVVVAWLINTGSLKYFNLDLKRVYEFRRNVSSIINVGVFSYLNAWVFKVFNPAMIAWTFYRKNYKTFVIFTSLQVLFYAISAHKSVLFYPVLILIIQIIIEWRFSLHLICLGIIGVIGISFFALKLDYILPASFFIRRLFYTPALLNYAYYNFFSQAGYVYLSSSIFSSIIKYPFPYPAPMMISYYLQGHTDTWMNNGFLACAYMHFGFIGMVLFSLFVGLLFYLVDTLVLGKQSTRFGLSLVVIPFFILFTSADLTTALLTHGVGINLFLLWLFESDKGLIKKQFGGDKIDGKS